MSDPVADFLAREQNLFADFDGAPPAVGDSQVAESQAAQSNGSSKGPSQTLSSVPRIEAEKVRLWKAEQEKLLAQKDAQEEKAKADLRSNAKKELEEWYKQREKNLQKKNLEKFEPEEEKEKSKEKKSGHEDIPIKKEVMDKFYSLAFKDRIQGTPETTEMLQQIAMKLDSGEKESELVSKINELEAKLREEKKRDDLPKKLYIDAFKSMPSALTLKPLAGKVQLDDYDSFTMKSDRANSHASTSSEQATHSLISKRAQLLEQKKAILKNLKEIDGQLKEIEATLSENVDEPYF